jgi:glutamine---fructose-6-phosphate transaminase (isomerizing)
MCGIVGILGQSPVAEQLVASLKRLEYRGYDSAGIATLEGGQLARRRAEGKLKNLEARLRTEPLSGHAGIGHTRWATHGKPTENNAHPHATERVAVVHNGIIENCRELREQLEKRGAVFTTDTDTETVLHQVDGLLAQGVGPVDAVRSALSQLRGAFALGFIFAGEGDLMIGARNGPPLAIGYGEGEMYLGSDSIALGPFTHDQLSRRRRLGRADAWQRHDLQQVQRDRASRRHQPHGIRFHGRQGQLPPLHGQGNP